MKQRYAVINEFIHTQKAAILDDQKQIVQLIAQVNMPKEMHQLEIFLRNK